MNSIYDRALHEIGSDKKYQKWFLLIYIVLLMGFWGMAYTNIILALTITPHSCKLPVKPENISELTWKLMYIPRKEDVKGHLIFDSCLIYLNPYENNHTVECHEYSYDKKWYDWTAPSEYNWVCDREINVANILAYSKVGEIVGSLFFGWFGDVYGRRLTYIISLFLIVIGRVISIVAGDSYSIFHIGCLVAYLPSWSVPQSLTVTAIEISSIKQRTIISVLRYISFSTGLVMMAFLFWWLRHWKVFMIVTSLPLIPFALLSWKMIESPRWLYTRGRGEECIKVFKDVAKVNGRQLNLDTEKQILDNAIMEKPQNLGFVALFSAKLLAINTIAQMCIWIATTSSYTVLIMSSGDETDGNPFLDFAWQAIADVPSVFLAAWLSDKYGRRYTGITSFMIMAAVWACLAIRETSTSALIQNWLLLSLLRLIARFMTNITYFIINLLNIELYPTCLRQSGMSLGNLTAGVCSAICPYILHMGRRIDPRLPGVVLTITSLLGVVSTMMVPETLNAKLPETLDETKKFGRSHKNIEEPQLAPLNS